ncbi:MAG: hypothetical protein OEV15_06385 [Gallionella sp.]|nr:hypothetical protein [Gallionella sp.]
MRGTMTASMQELNPELWPVWLSRQIHLAGKLFLLICSPEPEGATARMVKS